MEPRKITDPRWVSIDREGNVSYFFFKEQAEIGSYYPETGREDVRALREDIYDKYKYTPTMDVILDVLFQ